MHTAACLRLLTVPFEFVISSKFLPAAKRVGQPLWLHMISCVSVIAEPQRSRSYSDTENSCSDILWSALLKPVEAVRI